jgi:hypothetical protein
MTYPAAARRGLIREPTQIGLTAPVWRRSVNGTYRKEG